MKVESSSSDDADYEKMMNIITMYIMTLSRCEKYLKG